MNQTFQLSTLEEYVDYLNERNSENEKVIKAVRLLERKGENIDIIINDKTLSQREYIEVLAMRRQANYNSSTGNANERWNC